MEFCEKCGSVIAIQENKIACAGCGHKAKKRPKIEASEKIEKREAIAVINEAESTYPIVQIECPKCDNKKAFFWTTQTRAADESETKFYKCTKCNHTWRKYR
ncbi:MAG: transcription factor S [Candidatus Pacebacteria bacterium]|nr:transcription factor S [Candidatus Paceibacterota bacterium]